MLGKATEYRCTCSPRLPVTLPERLGSLLPGDDTPRRHLWLALDEHISPLLHQRLAPHRGRAEVRSNGWNDITAGVRKGFSVFHYHIHYFYLSTILCFSVCLFVCRSVCVFSLPVCWYFFMSVSLFSSLSLFFFVLSALQSTLF